MAYLLPQWINRLAALRGDMATSDRAVHGYCRSGKNEDDFRMALANVDDALKLLGDIFERENQISDERDEPRRMPSDGWATS